jgi:hypothetical protein
MTTNREVAPLTTRTYRHIERVVAPTSGCSGDKMG